MNDLKQSTLVDTNLDLTHIRSRGKEEKFKQPLSQPKFNALQRLKELEMEKMGKDKKNQDLDYLKQRENLGFAFHFND